MVRSDRDIPGSIPDQAQDVFDSNRRSSGDARLSEIRNIARWGAFHLQFVREEIQVAVATNHAAAIQDRVRVVGAENYEVNTKPTIAPTELIGRKHEQGTTDRRSANAHR